MKASPRFLQQRYEAEYAPKVDSMALDTVLRFKRSDAPEPTWFYRRAELNLFILCVHNVGEDVVIVRVD